MERHDAERACIRTDTTPLPSDRQHRDRARRARRARGRARGSATSRPSSSTTAATVTSQLSVAEPLIGAPLPPPGRCDPPRAQSWQRLPRRPRAWGRRRTAGGTNGSGVGSHRQVPEVRDGSRADPERDATPGDRARLDVVDDERRPARCRVRTGARGRGASSSSVRISSTQWTRSSKRQVPSLVRERTATSRPGDAGDGVSGPSPR